MSNTKPLNFKNEFRKLIKECQTEYRELEEEWDSLDRVGTQVERQRQISNKMTRLVKRIELYEELLKGIL